MLDELIADLSDIEKPITGCLLKAKVLLADLGHSELLAFVNRELNGYAEGDELPPYRIVAAQVKGNVANVAWHAQSHPLPTHHLGAERRKKLEQLEVRQGLGEIEDMCSRNLDAGSISSPIPMEFTPLLSKGFAAGAQVSSAWCEVNLAQFKNIATLVRSRMLDFVLDLRERVGGKGLSEDHIRSKAASVDIPALLNGAMFGDNTVIAIGVGNRQEVHNAKTMTVDTLVEQLKSVGVSRDDLDALRKAVAADKTENGVPSLTGHTGQWYQGLLAKAKAGAITIGTEVVTSSVATALVHFISLAAS
ncbi:MAG: hypothetical protein KGJ79_03965 [Alphaproteobacteria bacterium]|nr:hypothetical protein [Alphaproteobacteria bacterium]MDE2494814.1 hypothetical protein [Alphaproteobacteria bacterium]